MGHKNKIFELPLANTENEVTLVDEDVYELFKDTTLYKTPAGYAAIPLKGFLHRIILNMKKLHKQVDHKNRNRLDNRRENLRPVPGFYNLANRGKPKSGKTSRYRNVTKIRRTNKFQAMVRYNHRNLYLGNNYETQEEAALAVDKLNIYLYGEYTFLNLPEKVDLHESIRVRFVDYDQNLVHVLSKEEVEAQEEYFYHKRLERIKNKEFLDFYKTEIKKVFKHKLGYGY